jgi:hypothetical protein
MERELLTPAAFARRKGVSRAAVTRARARGRLHASVVPTDNGTWLVDALLGDTEWRENGDQTRRLVLLERKAAETQTHAHTPSDDDLAGVTVEMLEALPQLRADQFSVFARHGRIVFAVAAEDLADAGSWDAFTLTSEAARVLGEVLAKEAAKARGRR